MSRKQRERIAERLREAGLDVERFISCKPGSKASIDHTKLAPEKVEGNYGIYATATDGLLVLDIDDYDGSGDNSGFHALAELPPTLEQRSPHGGTHRLYAVEPSPDGKLIAAVLEEAFGVKNPAPTWGEVQVANKYVVGAGSQLDGCDKDWCDDCGTPDGGVYEIANDREIATVTASEIVEVLKADPDVTGVDSTTDDSPNVEPVEAPEVDADSDDILDYAREVDEKLDRLWRGDYSDYRDSDASDGVDRSRAESALAMKLAFWFQGDKKKIRRLMDRANTKKWAERTDDSYRESILSAVDAQTEYYDPAEHSVRDPSDFDPQEVQRGLAILQAETSRTNPAGELEHKNGCYGYRWQKTDDEGNIIDSGFDSVANFTLETLSYLETYEGTLFNLCVYPRNPREDPYEVQVSPTDFNSPDSFREAVVRGRTTWFEAHGKPQQQILNELRETVGSQDAPTRFGTEFIGLHGEDYEEWVTPGATMDGDGWQDDPEHVYYEKGGSEDQQSSLEDKWNLDSSQPTEYDPGEVKEIVERVPWTRQTDRGLPILGWWYAAPLKPYIMDIEGEFNLLQVTGGTGAGKTSTLQAFYRLFGADPDPFGASDKAFTIEKKLSGSCGLPIWLDEYKPSDILSGKLQRLHRRLREVTREKALSKGTPSLGEITMRLRAPVVFSGEQAVTEPAVKRRTIITNLSESGTEGKHQRAFGELVGTSYEGEDGEERYPGGYDLDEHAIAYYQFILQLDETTIRTHWKESREHAREVLRSLNVSLDGSEFQGIQTVIFGYRIFEDFADHVGADLSELPTETHVETAIEHVVSNIGPGGRRREHIDEFTELLSQAASADYLEHGAHYRLMESQKWEMDVLALHMPTAYSQVRKYVRDFNLDDTTSILGKGDYLDNFRDKAEEGGSYALAVNHRVRGLENGAKALILDPETAAETLDGDFAPSVFDPSSTPGEDDETDSTPLSEVEGEGNPFHSVTVKVGMLRQPTNDRAPVYSGTVTDSTATIEIVDWFGCKCLGELEEGKCYRLDDIKASYDSDGTLQLEPVKDTTRVTEIQPGVGYTAPESSEGNETLGAATDGGELEGTKGKVKELLRTEYEKGDVVTVPLVAGELDELPGKTEHALEALAQQGLVYKEDDSYEIT